MLATTSGLLGLRRNSRMHKKIGALVTGLALFLIWGGTHLLPFRSLSASTSTLKPFERPKYSAAANSRRLSTRPSLVRLKASGYPVYLWQAGAYHWIPRRQLMQAIGYQYRQAHWETALPGPSGHPLTFYYHPGDPVGYWYHAGYMYPVESYAPIAWYDWGHTVSWLPFPKSKTAVKLLKNGHIVRLKDRAAKHHPSPPALLTETFDGITFRYPSSWVAATEAPYLFQASGGQGNETMTLNVYPESDRSPASPLWFLGKYRVLPDDATTWSNGQGGVDYQASMDGNSWITIGVVQPLPNTVVGYAFRLQMTVPSTSVVKAWSILNQWSVTGTAATATLSGQNPAGSPPTFSVTLVGPKGRVTTTAELDTGNQGAVLINPTLAKAIGLVKTGTATEIGVNGYGDAQTQPVYQGLSIAPRGTSDWMLYEGVAEGWGLPGIDLGTDFLTYASETDHDGHWTITWQVQ